MKRSKYKTIDKKGNSLKKVQALCIALFGILLLAAVLSHNPVDTSLSVKKVHNWAGSAGAYMSTGIFHLIGNGGYLLSFLFFIYSGLLFKQKNHIEVLKQTTPFLLIIFSFILILSLNKSLPYVSHGGVIGALSAKGLKSLFGTFGGYLISIGILAGFILVFFKAPLKNWRIKLPLKKKEKKDILFDGGLKRKISDAPLDNSVIFKSSGLPRQEILKQFKSEMLQTDKKPPLIKKVSINYPKHKPSTHIVKYNDESVIISNETEPGKEDFFDNDINTPPSLKQGNPSEKQNLKNYQKPNSDILFKSKQQINEEIQKFLEYNANLLENTFNEFGIDAKVTNIRRGPVITRFEISIPPGVKLTKVVALQDNIALNLAAASIRIEAPIPGKSAIGIEVPNRTRAIVTLRDLLESKSFKTSKAKIPIALGKTVSGNSEVADLSSMPHLLIAGTTGAGKSVCVNGIICSILYNMRPDKVRFIMVDPKYVELAPYNGIPHLLIPVINKPKKAILALKWLVTEMERRYEQLQNMNTRNIVGFNEKLSTYKEKPVLDGVELEPMPYLVLIIDELADLMILAAKEIEDSISRLAAMSRAVGIHLIFATQRPSVDVITGVIKNNFPCRIAFQVASSIDSRTILDTKGADKLLGRGDSLFIGPGSPFPVRLQGAFLSEEEVDKTTEYLRSLGEPEYNMEILENNEKAMDENGNSIEDEPLFEDAVNVVLSSQRASASYIQRRLKVGYNRAARMIELMEDQGIIGPQNGSKPREILMGNLG